MISEEKGRGGPDIHWAPNMCQVLNRGFFFFFFFFLRLILTICPWSRYYYISFYRWEHWDPGRWNEKLKVIPDGYWQRNSHPLLQVHCPFHAMVCLFRLCFEVGRYRSSRCGSLEINLIGIHEDAGWIPGPAQWVKDPVLLQAAVKVADRARIWRFCGCVVDRWL